MKRNIFVSAAVIIAAVFLIYNFFLSGNSEHNINSSGFEELVKNNDVVILDVRSKFEFGGEKIAGSQNISYPAKDFTSRIEQLDRGKTYLVYCATGSRSAGAIKVMKELGFKNIYNLSGGFEHWKSDGKPVVR